MLSRTKFAWVRVAAGGVLTLAFASYAVDEREVELASPDPGAAGASGLGELGVGEPGAGGTDATLGAGSPTPPGEQGPEPTVLTPPEGTDVSSGSAQEPGGCVDGSTESCGPEREEGICRFGTRSCANGEWGECEGAVLPAARDCSSEADNDCDGQPDSTVDDVCRCPVGGTQTCDEHPGLDGRGPCVAGTQTCVAAPDNQSSDWGPCEGSVGPGAADSCEIAGDDSDCDGTPNGGCNCADGASVACGPDTDDGICQRGLSTCNNEEFGECQGAVFPARRDCTSAVDNDCDGQPDDSIDATCTCAVGSTRACGTHPGRDGNGPCRAGTQTCVAGNQNASSSFGACTGSVGPAQRDSCTVLGDDADCDGTPNGGCQCVAGRGNQPCAGDPNNSRCDAQGRCVPCQANADCSLVSGGRNLCIAGVCSAPRCGDGIVQANRGEECDDGALIAGDGCSPACQIVHAPVGASAFGGGHMCMLQPSGEIICWGTNGSGELGNGTTATGVQGPTRVFGVANATQVAVGPANTCAVRSTGRVACWGLGFTPTPTEVAGLAGVSHFAIAATRICALANGRVSCAAREPGAPVGSFVDMGLESIVQIDTGNGQACAVGSSGALFCWGSNNAGQLGIGAPSNPVETPQRSLAVDVAEVAPGGETTCVRLRDGGSQCFGAGPLGSRAAPSSSPTPQDVVSLPSPLRFAAASGSRCALLSDQSVRCWGSEPFGDADGAPLPVALPGRAVEIGAGSDVMCAVLEDLSVRCWGSNLRILGLQPAAGGVQVPVELIVP